MYVHVQYVELAPPSYDMHEASSMIIIVLTNENALVSEIQIWDYTICFSTVFEFCE